MPAIFTGPQGAAFLYSLTEFMTSGPIIVMVLEGENVIQRNRELMGATIPEELYRYDQAKFC